MIQECVIDHPELLGVSNRYLYCEQSAITYGAWLLLGPLLETVRFQAGNQALAVRLVEDLPEVGQLVGDLVVVLVEVGPQLLVAFAEPARARMVMQPE